MKQAVAVLFVCLALAVPLSAQSVTIAALDSAIAKLQAALADLITERDRLIATVPVETCAADGTGNGVDEDRDGQVDEGCLVPPPPLVEVCNADGTGNGLDDDGDGLIDEICLPPPDPTVVWPPKHPPEPTTEEIALIKRGLGYPQPRRYASYQWHDSELNDPDNMRHIHVELSHPRVVGAEIVRFDVFSTLFHFGGGTFEGITKFVPRGGYQAPYWMPTYVSGKRPGERVQAIPVDATGHFVTYSTPLYVDYRGVKTPGWYPFDIDSTAVRPDQKKANARGKVILWVDPTGVTPPTEADIRRLLHAEGWVSSEENGGRDFSYLVMAARGLREYLSDLAQPIVMEVPASAANVGQTVSLGVYKNPDMHQHPAHYGEIVYERTITLGDEATKKITIPHPSTVVGDRTCFRVLHLGDPTIGAGATLVCGTLSESAPSTFRLREGR